MVIIIYKRHNTTKYYNMHNMSLIKFVSYDENSITYDAMGNPLTYDGYTFDWNGRTLDSITGNSKTLNFLYNENGLRTKKQVIQNNVTTNYSYIWNNSQLVSQSGGTNTFYFFYNNSEYAPDGFVLNGTDIYFYTKNLQGDVTGIVNSNGAVVTSYTYDAWGNVLSIAGTLASTIGAANPIRYRGYYYDAETGLYYLQSRYYSPEWGRFINADEMEYLNRVETIQSSNLYGYCCNDSVNYNDNAGTNSDVKNWVISMGWKYKEAYNKYSIKASAIKSITKALNKIYKVVTGQKDNMDKAKKDILTHAINVVNIRYCIDKKGRYSYMYLKSFATKKEEYEKYCYTKFESMWVLISGGENYDISGKCWVNIPNDIKIKILDMAMIWDRANVWNIAKKYAIKGGEKFAFAAIDLTQYLIM